jgi:deoxyhypusine synthase
MSKGPISQFIEKHYLHFNSAALVDAAKAMKNSLQMELNDGNFAEQ